MILIVHVVVVVISVGASADMLMAAGKKGGKKAAPKPAASAKLVNQRGSEWEAVKLTGRATELDQQGKLPNGAPHHTYEVVWLTLWRLSKAFPKLNIE